MDKIKIKIEGVEFNLTPVQVQNLAVTLCEKYNRAIGTKKLEVSEIIFEDENAPYPLPYHL